ncbi:MAG: hypothetical protein QY311_03075 [Candidatus Paceibacterota bacterium]|nr:MAG: hypothetical protein QY311_03075 [Candidatus Paceibacterota bacterium]
MMGRRSLLRIAYHLVHPHVSEEEMPHEEWDMAVAIAQDRRDRRWPLNERTDALWAPVRDAILNVPRPDHVSEMTYRLFHEVVRDIE